LLMKADTVTKVDINADDASYFNGGLVSFGAGIVETNGVLKENLLTNSGFDVWSNSTLEDVATVDADTMASDDTGDWTDSASATLAFDADHYELATSATNQSIETTFTALTVGKLYELSLDVKDGTASSQPLYFTWYFNGTHNGNSPTFTTAAGPSFVTHTWVFEATGAATAAYIKVSNDMSGGNVELKNFTLKEVTPGCVAGDALAMDGWLKSTSLDIWRQHNDGGTNTKDGSFYALKSTTASTSQYVWGPSFYNKPEWSQRFAGRTVTFGCWAKTSTANHCRLGLGDGSTSYSDYHTGGGAWEWLEVTKSISASAAQFFWGIYNDVTATDAYISQPMLVFGSAIGSGNYSRPSGEIVNCEKFIQTQINVTPAAADDKVLNLEALSSGKIPKGCKAVAMMAEVKNSSITSDQGILWGTDSTNFYALACNPAVNNVIHNVSGRVPCDSSGDVYQKVTEAGETLSGLYQYMSAVELR